MFYLLDTYLTYLTPTHQDRSCVPHNVYIEANEYIEGRIY